MATSYFCTNSSGSFSAADGSDPTAGNSANDGTGRYMRVGWPATGLHLPLGSSRGLALDNSPLTWVTPAIAPPADFWTHLQLWRAYSASYDQAFLKFYDASGVARLMVVSTTTGLEIVTRNAAGTVAILATSTSQIPTYSVSELNVHLNYATSGGVTLYGPLGGVLISYTGNVTTDGVTSIVRVGFGVPGGSGGFDGNLSEINIQDTDTRNCGVLSMPITGAGVVNSFDGGSYTDVNSAGYDDTHYLTSLTAGEQFLGLTAPVVPSGSWAVAGVSLAMRAQVSASGGPQHSQLLLRTNDGVTHVGGTLAPGPYFGNFAEMHAVNPSTGVPWTVSELSGVQIGCQSAA